MKFDQKGSPRFASEAGAMPVLILVAIAGLIGFLAISSTFGFKNNLFSALFPKPASQAATTIGKYEVFELTLNYPSTTLTNPWEGAVVTANFTSPSGKQLTIEGFYYDVNTYKVRFAPNEIGTYNYSVSITGPTAFTPQTGSFDVAASPKHGFVRRLPGSPYKLMYEDGSVFFGMGFNDCWGNNPPNGILQGIIGDPAIEPVGEGGTVDVNTYFQKYASGGFNLFRWNPGNCSFGIKQTISTTGNSYLVNEGKLGDQLLATAKNNNFSVMFTFYVGNPLFPTATEGSPEAAALKKYISYAVARYGVYTDIWEITNETSEYNPTAPWTMPDAWLQFQIDHLRSIDPYKRLVTNSNPRSTDANYLDIKSPHLYGQTWDFYGQTNKTIGLPAVPGEVGRVPGGGGTPLYNNSEIAKMRLADWTAFFGGVGVIYWNTSFKTDCCNQYMGSVERAQNKILADFAKNIDADFVPTQAGVQSSCGTGYTFTSTNAGGAYIYCGGSIAAVSPTPQTTQTATFSMLLPFGGTASWIDTKTGAVVQSFPVTSGLRSFTTPTYTEDIALKITFNPNASPSPSSSLPPGTNQATLYSKTGDGRLGYFGSGGCTQTTWNTAHASTTAGASYTDTIRPNFVNSGCLSANGISIGRGFLAFDTSIVPANATITQAKVGLYLTGFSNAVNDGNDFISVIEGLQSSDTSLIGADYTKAGDNITNPQEGSNRLDITNMLSNSYNSWDLNQTGINWIQKGGTTKLALREGHDILDIWANYVGQVGNTINVAMSENPGTTQDPYLEITYTLPSPSSSPSPSPIPGDIVPNNRVDIFDYNQLLSDFGKTGPGLISDIVKNDRVDIFDYNLLLSNFGKSVLP